MEQLIAAGLPYPLPRLNITPTYPYLGLTPDAYGQIITDTARVYRHPLEALAGFPSLRTFEKGFVFVSVQGKVNFQGQDFYEINHGEFVAAEAMEEFRPSTFQGMFFSAPLPGPVGWLIGNVQPSAVPGQPPDPNAAWAGQYQPFQVHGVQRVGDWNWYLIGPGQWVEQRNVALVQPFAPPGTDGNLIAVDTYEQSLGVYQNGQLLFATLVSSGSRYFPTRPGTFKVWARLNHGRMTGAYRRDRSDYYFLEDVPWILYYDGDRALHGAYWHNHFGVRGSHGCVNLSPRDARWLYEYASVGATVMVFSSQ
ncbi:MAG: L,D-transpeptidase [Anaerolineales bacterium]